MIDHYYREHFSIERTTTEKTIEVSREDKVLFEFLWENPQYEQHFKIVD